MCDRCNAAIDAKSDYYAEKLADGVRKPPQLRLGKLCEKCYTLAESG